MPIGFLRFAALTGRSPAGDSYLAGLAAPPAKLLQTVVWDGAGLLRK
ncbi:MAG TPA: hypothetical protein VIQ05_20385 [Tardiphaga sp.]